jgi:hypothetical protein
MKVSKFGKKPRFLSDIGFRWQHAAISHLSTTHPGRGTPTKLSQSHPVHTQNAVELLLLGVKIAKAREVFVKGFDIDVRRSGYIG